MKLGANLQWLENYLQSAIIWSFWFRITTVYTILCSDLQFGPHFLKGGEAIGISKHFGNAHLGLD